MPTEVVEDSDAQDNRPLAFILSEGLEGICRRYLFADKEEPDAAMLMLGQALASSPLWQKIPRASMVIRLEPRPMLGVLGYFDAAAEVRVESLHGQLDGLTSRLRYVDYSAAEQACEQLAHRLTDRFGPEAISQFHYVPIARGGFIVLGLLSYFLKLRHDQMEPPFASGRQVVVVDDCALTGLRFGQFLKRSEARDVIFAPLFSHPDLRAAIETREPRVSACISAQDLHDHAPERLGDKYTEWRSRWQARSDNNCYWIGQPDHVSFPWSEPDETLWNVVTGEEEGGWFVVPPAYCLRNRSRLNADAKTRLQVQPPGTGPLKPAATVLFAEFEGQVLIADSESETTFRLGGIGGDFWRAIVAEGNESDAIRRLLDDYDVDEPTLAADLAAFIGDLVDRGLLEQSDHSDSRS